MNKEMQAQQQNTAISAINNKSSSMNTQQQHQQRSESYFQPLSSFSVLMSADSVALAADALGDLAAPDAVHPSSPRHHRQNGCSSIMSSSSSSPSSSSSSCIVCCSVALGSFARALLQQAAITTQLCSSSSALNDDDCFSNEADPQEQSVLTEFKSNCTCHQLQPAATEEESGAAETTSAAPCCASVLKFAASLNSEMQQKLGEALKQLSCWPSTKNKSNNDKVEGGAAGARQNLALVLASVAQEFFTFRDTLPAGIDKVALEAQPEVVGMGGDMGSVVWETKVVKSTEHHHNQQHQHKSSSLLAFSHVKRCERFCVKLTRHQSYFGFRTPTKPLLQHPHHNNNSLSSLAQHQQIQSPPASNLSVSSSTPATSASSSTTITSHSNNNNNSNNGGGSKEGKKDRAARLLLVDSINSIMPNSVQERQFYGVVKAAAALRSDSRISQRLLVPLASLDPQRFSDSVDPHTVAQCLLLERWDGDLRWAKEKFMSVTSSSQKDDNGHKSKSKKQLQQDQLPAPPAASSSVDDRKEKADAVPSFLKKFAAVAPPSVPPAPAQQSAAAAFAVAVVEVPSFLKKFAAAPKPPAAAAALPAAPSSTSTTQPGTPRERDARHHHSNNPSGCMLLQTIISSSSYPSTPLTVGYNNNILGGGAGGGGGEGTGSNSPNAHYSIFNTKQQFRRVTNYDALGCVAYQLFSALHALHSELPHLAESSSAFSSTLLDGGGGGNNNNSGGGGSNRSVKALGRLQQQRDKTCAVLCSGYTHNDIHSGNLLISQHNCSLCICDFEHVTDIVADPACNGAENEQQQQQQRLPTSGALFPSSAQQDDAAAEAAFLLDGDRSAVSSPTTPDSPSAPAANAAATQNMPFRITPQAYTPPELTSAPKRDVWAATLILFELFIGVCPVVNALEAGNDMSQCFLTVDEEFGLDWRHFETLLSGLEEAEQQQQHQTSSTNPVADGDCDRNRILRAQFLDICRSGLQNNPVCRFDAGKMMLHPFLTSRTAEEWEKLILSSPPIWKL